MPTILVTEGRPHNVAARVVSRTDEAFIIMQIGEKELDSVCDFAIEPAIRDAGFAPRRVDRHNAGDLLKSEVVQFIERSQIIVADVTNERPNCYLEIGYAMGLGKKANLILTARKDHHHGSPLFDRHGPKVHFDLEGYDILFWDPADLSTFRQELARRIARRAAIVRGTTSPPAVRNGAMDWRYELRAQGESGIAQIGNDGYMELAADLQPTGTFSQSRLLETIQVASIHTFGWPIAVVLDNRDEYRPRPTGDGIVAEIPIHGPGTSTIDQSSYDLWKLFRDGRFYTLMSLFEDKRNSKTIFFDTRIIRVTEAILLLGRLYRRLDASDTDVVTLRVRHQGLAGRTLRPANPSRDIRAGRTSAEDVAESVLTRSLAELESDLVGCVSEVVQPLFVLFDFFEVNTDVLAQIVDGFVEETARRSGGLVPT